MSKSGSDLNAQDTSLSLGSASAGVNVDGLWVKCEADGKLPPGRVPFLDSKVTRDKYIYRRITNMTTNLGIVGQVEKNYSVDKECIFPPLLPPLPKAQVADYEYEILAPQPKRIPEWRELVDESDFDFYYTGLSNVYVGWHPGLQRIGIIYLCNNEWIFQRDKDDSIDDKGIQILASKVSNDPE